MCIFLQKNFVGKKILANFAALKRDIALFYTDSIHKI